MWHHTVRALLSDNTTVFLRRLIFRSETLELYSSWLLSLLRLITGYNSINNKMATFEISRITGGFFKIIFPPKHRKTRIIVCSLVVLHHFVSLGNFKIKILNLWQPNVSSGHLYEVIILWKFNYQGMIRISLTYIPFFFIKLILLPITEIHARLIKVNNY
jgi:hypothetical protein